GLATEEDEAAFDALFAGGIGGLVWAEADPRERAGIAGADNQAAALAVKVIRASGAAAPGAVTVAAHDDRGRRVAEAEAIFGPGESEATARFAVPFELRNDFSTLSILGHAHAGAVHLL